MTADGLLLRLVCVGQDYSREVAFADAILPGD
jgi:hypothetical protein